MQIFRKNLGKTATILVALMCLVINVESLAADLLLEAAADENIGQNSGEIMELESIGLPGSACEDWASDRGWRLGNNEKKDGTPFFVSTGSGTILVPPADSSYIDSRQNAYEKAMLNAKGALVSYMGKEIENRIITQLDQGNFSKNELGSLPNDSDSGQPKEHGWLTAYNKTLRLLHAELDDQLETRGVKAKQELTEEEKAEAKAAAREVLNSEAFQQLTRSTAKSQLKGVRRMFVQESVPSDGQGEICVVALGSPKTMAMADAIMTGNPSIAPTGYFGSPLNEQIPNHKTSEGLKTLLTTYGVQMVRDEVGQFHLISFAQSGAKSQTNTSINIAKKMSEERAAAALASFAGEHASVTRRTENAESSKEFVDTMGQVEYDSVSAFQEIMKSETPMINLAGGRALKQWMTKHPISGQIIVGTVYAWSADSAAASKTLKSTIESTTAGSETEVKVYTNTGTGQSLEGSASAGSSDADF